MNLDKIREIEEVFGDDYTCMSNSVGLEEEILGCDSGTSLPQINNPTGNYFTAIYYDTTWKAAVWRNADDPRLITATSLHSLKVKLDLL